MAQIKPIFDEYGIIYEAFKTLPSDELKLAFLEALAELEDNENYRTRNFPKTKLRRVSGIKEAIYRANVIQKSGWRLHVQYGKDGNLHLKDLLDPTKHDDPVKAIKAKKSRYE